MVTDLVKKTENLMMYRHQLPMHTGFINLFCAIYEVDITEIRITEENYPERNLIYFFDDNYGGYTISGIINSLIDKL